MRVTNRLRLHVVGCQRSGTTLMMELLWSCFDLGDRCTHEQSLFESIPAGDSVYLTKKPPDTSRIGPVFVQDERLFVVAMLRDPRAVITSRHDEWPDRYFSSFHRWQRHARAIAEYRAHPRYVVVRYEDLVRDPQAVQNQIKQRFEFLEEKAKICDYPHAQETIGARPSVSLGGVRPLDTNRIDGWREHLPRIKGQLQLFPELAGAVKEFGYEPDDAWLHALEGVEPLRQDYKEAPPHLLKRLETNFRYLLKRRRYRAARGLG